MNSFKSLTGVFPDERTSRLFDKEATDKRWDSIRARKMSNIFSALDEDYRVAGNIFRLVC